MPDISKVNIDEFSYSSNKVNSSTSGGSASSTPSTPIVKAQDVKRIAKYAKKKVKQYKKRKKEKEKEKKRQIREQKRLEREKKQAEKQARYDALSTKDKLKKQTQWLQSQMTRLEKNPSLMKMIGDRYKTYVDKLQDIKKDIDNLSESQLKVMLSKTEHMREMASAKGLRETTVKRAEGLANFLLGDAGKEAKQREIESLEIELLFEQDEDKKKELEEQIEKVKRKNTEIKFEYDKKKDVYTITSGDTTSTLSSADVSEFWRLFRDAYDDSWLSNLKNYDKGEEGVNTVFDEYMAIKKDIVYADGEAYINDDGEQKTVSQYLHDRIQQIVDEEQRKEKAMLKNTENDFLKSDEDRLLWR